MTIVPNTVKACMIDAYDIGDGEVNLSRRPIVGWRISNGAPEPIALNDCDSKRVFTGIETTFGVSYNGELYDLEAFESIAESHFIERNSSK